MSADSYQCRFFDQIKQKLNPKEQLVHIIGELLFMQKDATYRRIKGVTPLTMQELKILSTTFQISIDEILSEPIYTPPDQDL